MKWFAVVMVFSLFVSLALAANPATSSSGAGGGPNYPPQPRGGFGGGSGGYPQGPSGPDYDDGSGYTQPPKGTGFDGPDKGFGPAPRDFRGMGGFDLPPEAIEGMIFSEIGDRLESTFGEKQLLAKCSNQPELVDLILKEFSKTGVNLEKEICSEMEEGLSFCTDAKQQCEQIGNPEFGPRFGPDDDEKPFTPSCPPDENQIKQACLARMQKDFDINFKERLEDEEAKCQDRWDFDRPPNADEMCKNGKQRGPIECDKSEWVSECLARQPPEGDFGPGPYDKPPTDKWDQNQQRTQQCSPNPPAGMNCPGGKPIQKQGPGGCYWDCERGQSDQQNYQCPSGDELERKKTDCINSGGRWEGGNDGKCPYIRCIFPQQNQPGQPGQPSQGPQQCPQNPPQDMVNDCNSKGGKIATRPSPNGCNMFVCEGGQFGQPGQPPMPPQGQTPMPPQGQPQTQPPAQPPTQPPVPPQQPPAQPPQPPTQPPAQPPAQTAAMPFTGFVTGRMSAAERCEQEWSKNQARFAQNCQRMQQNKGPNFNFCNQQEFMSQCKQEVQKRFETEKQRQSKQVERQCASDVKRQVKDFARYCKDTQRGKEKCLKETERGCEFGKKQLQRCKELTSSENVKKAIEKAVSRECRRRTQPGRDGGLSKLRGTIPDEYNSFVDFEEDNVAEAKDKAKEIDQKSAAYALTQMIGMQAEQERKDAIALKEQSERLGKTIERLKMLSEQVESADAKVILQAQIADLEQQKTSMDARAKSKEEGASGIFSAIQNFLGLK